MRDVLILTYQDDDLPAIMVLWEAVFPGDSPGNQAPVAIPQKETFQPGLIFVAEREGEVIGTCMAGYDGHRGWLNAVAVHPDAQRQGIATKLIDHAVDALKALGCPKVNLQVRAGNEAVVAFYKTLGFDVEERVSMGKSLE